MVAHFDIFLLFTVLVTMASLLLCYVAALASKDIKFFDMPYISDIVLHSWSRCLFTLTMNMFAYFSALIIFMRYLHCKEMMASIGVNIERLRRLVRVNKGSLILGLFTCICLVAYSNFYAILDEHDKNSHMVHLICMMIQFFFGFVYITLQTYFSQVTRPNFTSNLQYRYQLVLNVALCVTMLATFILGLVAHESNVNLMMALESQNLGSSVTTTPIPPSPIHKTSAAFQWVTVFLLFAYYIGFVPVFRRIRLDFLLHTDTALSTLSNNIPGSNANIQVRLPANFNNRI